jgi:S-formylglutathione hydrolase
VDKPKLLNRYRSFDGWVEFYSHPSTSTQTEMRFSIYLPQASESRRAPVLYWLSGLTCTEENFMIKAGAQRAASQLGLCLVVPDTSPRGAGIEGEDAEYDLGTGASFYLNATQPKWAKHYQMETYLTQELPALLEAHFPVFPNRQGISGHSMGGHGAMVLSLRHPGRYLSVSAFSPICAPSRCPWGQKAFTEYLGADPAAWAGYDAEQLIQKVTSRLPILIDQGGEDPYLENQLMPYAFRNTCSRIDYPLNLRIHPGYDHSYYFVATFIEDHLKFHARTLNQF